MIERGHNPFICRAFVVDLWESERGLKQMGFRWRRAVYKKAWRMTKPRPSWNSHPDPPDWKIGKSSNPDTFMKIYPFEFHIKTRFVFLLHHCRWGVWLSIWVLKRILCGLLSSRKDTRALMGESCLWRGEIWIRTLPFSLSLSQKKWMAGESERRRASLFWMGVSGPTPNLTR